MNKFKVLLVLAPALLSGALAKEDSVRGIEDHHFKSTLNRKLNLFGESKCGCFSIDDCGACLLPAWLENGSTCAEICEGAECKVAKCDDSLGCYTEDMADNTPCDDGDLCTSGEVCNGGDCVGATPRDCSHLDDGLCMRGQCNPADGTCVERPVTDGTPCWNGDECVSEEICTHGVCGGGVKKDCSHLDDAMRCLIGECDPLIPDCVQVTAPDGTTCDDGDECTSDEYCKSGVCRGGIPKDCLHLDDEKNCLVGTCDPVAGCIQVKAPYGSSCGRQCTCKKGTAGFGCYC